MPLDARPSLAQMAVGRHGTRPVEHYRLKGLWCAHLYRYTGEVVMDGKVLPIRPRYASIAPPGVKLEYRYRGLSVHIYAHFSLPRTRGGCVSVAAMQDLGSDFPEVSRAFEQALAYFPTHLRWSEVKLWDILWQLAERGTGPGKMPALHPAVRQAFHIIERRLGERIRISELAQEVELSHNQLTRLFRAVTGNTIIGYIRERRMQRAKHLLVHSTLPIKAIAYEVGIGDLRLFNKTVRRTLGDAPRNVRKHLSR